MGVYKHKVCQYVRSMETEKMQAGAMPREFETGVSIRKISIN